MADSDNNRESRYPWWTGKHTFENLIHALIALILVCSLVGLSIFEVPADNIKDLVIVVVAFYFGNRTTKAGE